MKAFRLETERLCLREMNMEDFDALMAVLGDNENMKYYPHAFDEQKVRNLIERNMERYKTFSFGLWAVCLKDSGEMIGDCGLTMQNINKVIKPEIGYHIRRDMQQKGYAKEAAIAVRDWTFETLPFQEIYSYMKYTNIPSANSAQSWGCKFVYEYEDEVNTVSKVYCITRKEWENKKIRVIDDKISLVPYYPCYDVTFSWYQDLQLCKQVDNIDHPYSMELLKSMYEYLSSHGACYYIQYDGELVGDITLQDNQEISIVICKEYQNKHIGRRCILHMIALAKEKSYDAVKANIYSFNTQSQKVFESVGFQKTEEEWYEYKMDV